MLNIKYDFHPEHILKADMCSFLDVKISSSILSQRNVWRHTSKPFK